MNTRLMHAHLHYHQIKDAVFWYDPCYESKGRKYWLLGISTPEQRDAAWQYGHVKMVFMDGTFNICNKYVLLLLFGSVFDVF